MELNSLNKDVYSKVAEQHSDTFSPELTDDGLSCINVHQVVYICTLCCAELNVTFDIEVLLDLVALLQIHWKTGYECYNHWDTFLNFDNIISYLKTDV